MKNLFNLLHQILNSSSRLFAADKNNLLETEKLDYYEALFHLVKHYYDNLY